jgi:hypothetical protein
MSTPLAPVPPQSPRNEQGSLGLGIGLAWACLIAGYTASSVMAGLMLDAAPVGMRNGLAIFAVLLPWLLMVGLIVWLAQRGQSRTAIGIAVGIGSIIGVALLLVAACFGLLNMH